MVQEHALLRVTVERHLFSPPSSFCMISAVSRFILGGAVSLITLNMFKVCLNK